MDAYTVIYGIFASLLAASLISLVKSERVAFLSIVLFASTSFLLSLLLFEFPTVHNSWSYVDYPAKMLLLTINSVFLIAALHSHFCLSNIKNFNFSPNYYYSLLSGFALSMALAVTSPSLGYAWLWLEASTIISAALILIEKDKKHVESAWRYLLIASSGLGIAFLSIVLFGRATGTLLWFNANIQWGAFLIGSLSLVGFGTKAGLFPMHGWLPDAHGTAPSPVSALLSGALLPSSLIIYYRIFTLTHSLPLFYLTSAVGIATVWVAAILMVSQKYTKRLLAYSSMDVMGIATVGIALTQFYPNAIDYVLLIFLAHGISKSILFLSAGTLKRYGLEKIEDINDLIRSSPYLAFAVLISALTVTGAPPFAVFFGEFGIFVSLVHFPILFVSLLIGVFLSFAALNYHAISMLFQGEKTEIIKFSHSAVPFFSALCSLILIFLAIWGWF